MRAQNVVAEITPLDGADSEGRLPADLTSRNEPKALAIGFDLSQ